MNWLLLSLTCVVVFGLVILLILFIKSQRKTVDNSLTSISGPFRYNALLPVPPSNIPLDRWMGTLWPWISGKKLWELTMPGSHDSLSYACGKDIVSKFANLSGLVRAQDKNLTEQMNLGARYFDIRLRNTDSGFVGHHGPIDCTSVNLNSMMKAFYDFLTAPVHLQEIVIIRVQVEDVKNVSVNRNAVAAELIRVLGSITMDPQVVWMQTLSQMDVANPTPGGAPTKNLVILWPNGDNPPALPAGFGNSNVGVWDPYDQDQDYSGVSTMWWNRINQIYSQAQRPMGPPVPFLAVLQWITSGAKVAKVMLPGFTLLSNSKILNQYLMTHPVKPPSNMVHHNVIMVDGIGASNPGTAVMRWIVVQNLII
jgi:hypothetical protein